MKKLIVLLIAGLVILSAPLFAEGFNGGTYGGAKIEAIGIGDLADTTPNQYVIVNGTITLEKIPGVYVLSEGEDDEKVSVIVRIPPYAWANLEVDDATPIVVYGIVIKSDQGTEILADRIGLPAAEE